MSQSDQVSQGIWKFAGQFVLGCLFLVAISCAGCGVMSMSCAKVLHDNMPTEEEMKQRSEREAENIRKAEAGYTSPATPAQPSGTR